MRSLVRLVGEAVMLFPVSASRPIHQCRDLLYDLLYLDQNRRTADKHRLLHDFARNLLHLCGLVQEPKISLCV